MKKDKLLEILRLTKLINHQITKEEKDPEINLPSRSKLRNKRRIKIWVQ